LLSLMLRAHSKITEERTTCRFSLIIDPISNQATSLLDII